MARQMALAEQLDLPVVIHDRDAHGDCMDMVRAFPGVRGEFHCYSGSVEDARILLDRGWYLGFGGALTFKNAPESAGSGGLRPLDRLLLETDSPYLAPVPFRGKRNDSRYLPYVAERIAAIKGFVQKKRSVLPGKTPCAFCLGRDTVKVYSVRMEKWKTEGAALMETIKCTQSSAVKESAAAEEPTVQK